MSGPWMMAVPPASPRIDARGRFGITATQLAGIVAQGSAAVTTIGGWRELERLLQTDFSRGLDHYNAEALQRRAEWFRNVEIVDIRTKIDPSSLHVRVKRSAFRAVFGVLARDQATIVLFFAAVSTIGVVAVSLVLDVSVEIVETVSIVALALGMITIRAIVEWRQHSQLQALYTDTKASCIDPEHRIATAASGDVTIKVIRGGESIVVQASELRVGDIVRLHAGDMVPADGFLLAPPSTLGVRGVSVAVDESWFSGAVDAEIKDPIDSGDVTLREGSRVIRVVGEYATMVVLCIGVTSTRHQLETLATQRHHQAENSASVRRLVAPTKYRLVTDRYTQMTSPRPTKLDTSQWIQKEKKTSRSKTDRQLQAIQKMLTACGLAAAVLVNIVLTSLPDRHDPSITTLPPNATEAEKLLAELEASLYRQRLISSSYMTAFSVVFIFSPEGLAVVLALAFSLALPPLIQRHASVVQELSAAATAGAITTLCVDKTGTLTTAQHTASLSLAVVSSKNRLDFQPPPPPATLPLAVRERLTLCLAVGSHAPSVFGVSQCGGDGVDHAIQAVLGQVDAKFEVQRRYKDCKTQVLPFSRALSSVAVTLGQDNSSSGGNTIVVATGPVEAVLRQCTSIHLATGLVIPLRDSERQQLLLSQSGQRVVCLAYREIEGQLHERDAATGLTCMGIVAVDEPLRRGASDAISTLRSTGVDVWMVTGDHLSTAVAVARQCGILLPSAPLHTGKEEGSGAEGSAMTAAAFRDAVVDPTTGELDVAAIKALAPSLRVVARASPHDKRLIVAALQLANHCVGVVGDGVDDVLAMVQGDVSFCCGAGVPTADVVVLEKEDAWGAIVTAAGYGRVVVTWLNVYLERQLVAIMVAVALIVAGAVVGVDVTAEQIVWLYALWIGWAVTTRLSINISISTAAASPRTLVDAGMARRMLLQGVYQLTVLLVLLCHGEALLGRPSANPQRRLSSFAHGFQTGTTTGGGGQSRTASTVGTVVFNSCAWIQLCLMMRGMRVHRRRFLVGWTLLAACQVAFVQQLGEFFICVPLTLVQWLLCLAVGASALAVDRGLAGWSKSSI